MAKTISQQQLGQLLTKAPPTITRQQLIDGLKKRGYEVEGDTPAKTRESGGGSAPFPINPGEETYGSQALKTAGNLPSSILNFAKGVATLPMEAVKEGKKAFSDPGVPGDSFLDATIGTLKKVPGVAYEALVPQALRSAISGDLDTAQKAIGEDPFGQVAPALFAARGVAGSLGKGAAFDRAISKAASPVTRPVSAVSEALKKGTTKTAEFGVSQTTGLNPETINTAIKSPRELGAAIKQGVTRESIAQQVRDALDARLSELSETGKGYEAIRSGTRPVQVPFDAIPETLRKFGIELDGKGKIITTKESRPISAADKSALQEFVDTFGKETNLSPNAFLNAREALSNLSKFEQGKTDIPKLIAKELRKRYDDVGKEQIEGLRDLDATYSTERDLLNRLKKDFLESNTAGGVRLKDGAINKIANATGKGKDQMLARLEELIPDIAPQLKVLKAVEDIGAAKGQKVGTYFRTGAGVAGAVSFNPALIVAAILATPEIAVTLLRGLGMTLPKIQSVLRLLEIPFEALNNLPEKIKVPVGPANSQR